MGRGETVAAARHETSIMKRILCFLSYDIGKGNAPFRPRAIFSTTGGNISTKANSTDQTLFCGQRKESDGASYRQPRRKTGQRKACCGREPIKPASRGAATIFFCRRKEAFRTLAVPLIDERQLCVENSVWRAAAVIYLQCQQKKVIVFHNGGF